MAHIHDDDFAITVQPADEGGWNGALIDSEGVVWPVGRFADADAAIRSALITRAMAVSLHRPLTA